MQKLTAPDGRPKVAWVTGAGTGIGEAAALALARDGAELVLTGRRPGPLETVAAAIRAAGGTAHVRPADVTDRAAVQSVADGIAADLGRLHILVNNAGINVAARSLARITPDAVDEVLAGNLASAFHAALAALHIMRAQKDGCLIHTSSTAGRTPMLLTGAAYSAAKHGVVSLSQSINIEDCVNGIRSCVILPGEVATPLLDKRPVPVSAEDRARMLQPEDVGGLIAYIAGLPARVCITDVMMTPTWNRALVADLARQSPPG